MKSVAGQIQYTTQLGSKMTDRSSFDLSAPYTVCCNYRGRCSGEDLIEHKFCVIESPGTFNVSDAGAQALLGKNVIAVVNDSFIDVVGTSTGADTGLVISMYVGTPDDVVGSSTVYLYYYRGYIVSGQRYRFDIPDISKFGISSGKNIVVTVSSTGPCYVGGHFVCSVDD